MHIRQRGDIKENVWSNQYWLILNGKKDFEERTRSAFYKLRYRSVARYFLAHSLSNTEREREREREREERERERERANWEMSVWTVKDEETLSPLEGDYSWCTHVRKLFALLRQKWPIYSDVKYQSAFSSP
jgi:hypothetical protein